MPDPFEELAAAPRWVVWRQEERGGKPTKVPYNVTGGRAKTDDPSTWAPRLDAERQAKRWLNGAPGGVGVVLGDLGGDVWLAGLDLDSSVDDGLVADWAAEILATVRSYCEVSPSGRGLKMFFYAAAEDVREFLGRLAVPSGQWGLKRGIPGLSGADHGPGIELYCSHRYFTVTRQRWSSGADRIVLLDSCDAQRSRCTGPGARSPKRRRVLRRARHVAQRESFPLRHASRPAARKPRSLAGGARRRA